LLLSKIYVAVKTEVKLRVLFLEVIESILNLVLLIHHQASLDLLSGLLDSTILVVNLFLLRFFLPLINLGNNVRNSIVVVTWVMSSLQNGIQVFVPDLVNFIDEVFLCKLAELDVILLVKSVLHRLELLSFVSVLGRTCLQLFVQVLLHVDFLFSCEGGPFLGDHFSLLLHGVLLTLLVEL